MKNVLLIGDSLRLGYQARVAELLGEDVRVYAPEENCRFTKYALWGMYSWMECWGNPHIDVIHWNTGVWDLHRCTADGEIFTPLEEYLTYQRRMITQMASYCPRERLIWATISPGNRYLDEQKALNSLINTDATAPKVYLCDTMEKWNADVMRYNAAATVMMKEEGIRVNDLCGLLMQDLDRYISEDGIHPSAEGYELLARQVASEILTVL